MGISKKIDLRLSCVIILFFRGSSDEEEEDEDKIESLDNIEKAMAEIMGEGTEEKGAEGQEEQRHPEVAKADPQNAEKQPSVPQQQPVWPLTRCFLVCFCKSIPSPGRILFSYVPSRA